MATGFTDFGEFDTGSLPEELVAVDARGGAVVTVEELPGSLSGQALSVLYDSGTIAAALVGWTTPGDIADGEVTALIRVTGPGFGAPIHGVAARFTEGSTTTDLVGATLTSEGNSIDARYGNNDNAQLSAFSDSESKTVAEDERWWIRYNFSGDDYKVRAWKAADDEPETWDIEVTDEAPEATTGKVGVYVEIDTDDADNTAWVEAIGYSDNPAVSAPLTGAAAAGDEIPRGRTRGRIVTPLTRLVHGLR